MQARTMCARSDRPLSTSPGHARRRPAPVTLCGGAMMVLLIILVGGAAPALAEGEEAAADTRTPLQKQVEEQLGRLPSGEEGVQQILTELDKRLSLSAEQDNDVREVVSESVADLGKLRERFESGELTAMAFGVQVQMQLRKMGDLVEPLLNADQQVEYKAMRQEQRREMMQAMQKQRMGAAKGN